VAVFLSYSHEDKDFVDHLAIALVKEKTNVWVDRWELRVGDSLIERIQDAIKEADALVVVLSKASVESPWCKKELSAGLIRELEERRVVVLPVVVDDCEIPLFLRDKMYADFRNDRDEGLRQVLESLARVISTSLGRMDT
jgi:TIR domain